MKISFRECNKTFLLLLKSKSFPLIKHITNKELNEITKNLDYGYGITVGFYHPAMLPIIKITGSLLNLPLPKKIKSIISRIDAKAREKYPCFRTIYIFKIPNRRPYYW